MTLKQAIWKECGLNPDNFSQAVSEAMESYAQFMSLKAKLEEERRYQPFFLAVSKETIFQRIDFLEKEVKNLEEIWATRMK